MSTITLVRTKKKLNQVLPSFFKVQHKMCNYLVTDRYQVEVFRYLISSQFPSFMQ